MPHALKITANYELPFGRGKRFGRTEPWLDGAAGGWSLNLTGRVQSGSVLNFGNVRVVGMTLDELQDAFEIRIDPATKIVYTLPQDIIDNTIKAFSTSATSATGYGALGAPSGRYLAPANGPDCIQTVRGDCAPHDVFVEGPIFTRFDLNVKKRFDFGGIAKLRPRPGRAESLQRHQLYRRGANRDRCDDQPGDRRLSGSERDIRSRRPGDAAGVPAEFLEAILQTAGQGHVLSKSLSP